MQSFKELLLEMPFEKITIKRITDKAGVIRPTFYNYFPDKYAIFEEILGDELIESVYKLIDLKMINEAVSMVFVYFEQNKAFYREAFKITGQNAFEVVLQNKLEEMFLYAIDTYTLQDKDALAVLTPHSIAHFYTIGIVDMVKNWCNYTGSDYNVNDLIKAYHYLVSHSLHDIFSSEKKEKKR